MVNRLQAGSVTLLDVRPAEEYAAGHLPGAINIPLAELTQRLQELPADCEVVAYCRGPYCALSHDAAALLQQRGFTALRLQEGYPEWKAEGLHPIEIFLSMGIKIAAIALLGAPPVAVLIFEVLLNATAMFNHGNVSLPRPLDRLLRWVVVTPDMHRIHHSIIVQETNSNYGFNLPWWDYLFGTYRSRPAKGYEGMTIGLSEYQNTLRVAQLPWMLLLPFRQPSESPLIPQGSSDPFNELK